MADNAGVHVWRVTSPSDGRYHHEIEPGLGHALLAPIVSRIFQTLRVSASIWDGRFWWALHSEPTVSEFEFAHGLDRERYAYNERNLERAVTLGEAVRGEHVGFCDAFVPINIDDKVAAVLVTGPYSVERPSSARVLELWRRISGRQGHPADPEFALYLSATLSTLTLDAAQAPVFEELLACLARLMSGSADAAELVNRADGLRAELESARTVERTWDAVRTMIDERTTRSWSSISHAFELKTLGLPRAADHVLVGLGVDRAGSADPVDEALRRHALQRRSVEIARRAGNAIAGQVGDHGVLFLASLSGTARQKREALSNLAERTARTARRELGLSLYFGACVALGSAPLSHSYQAALAAAESALEQGRVFVMADAASARGTSSLRQMRRELTRAVRAGPSALAARFEKYVHAVAVESGYRIDRARAELDVGFTALTEPLLASSALDPKSFDTLCEELDRAAMSARTLGELFAAYRRAVLDVVATLERPVSATHDRSLRRAVDYLKRHYSEPIRLEAVAHIAGFSPSHFSELFRQRQGRTFVDFVAGLRIEHARQLLATSRIPVQRVGELSGLGSPQYFSRVFRVRVGMSPKEYREKSPGAPTKQSKPTARRAR